MGHADQLSLARHAELAVSQRNIDTFVHGAADFDHVEEGRLERRHRQECTGL